MYPFMTLRVHFHTFIPINRWDLPVNVSAALHVSRRTWLSVYLLSLFLPFWHNMHIYLSTHLLGYVHRDPPENKSTSWSPLPKNKNLPGTTTTFVPALKCTRSWPYLFIFILVFYLINAKIYPSTFLQLYMSTDISGHQYTCLVYFFLFGITCTVTFPLIC